MAVKGTQGDRDALLDIIEYVICVGNDTRGCEDSIEDDTVFRSVLYSLAVIGEAQTELQRICAMRTSRCHGVASSPCETSSSTFMTMYAGTSYGMQSSSYRILSERSARSSKGQKKNSPNRALLAGLSRMSARPRR